MKSILAAVVVGALSVSSVYAQSPTESTRSMAVLQQQIDRLFAERAPVPDPKLYISLDKLTVNASAVMVDGWGMDCPGGAVGTIEMAVDGVIVPGAAILRTERRDVYAWVTFHGFCEPTKTPWMSGASGWIDLANYAAGEHTITMRIRNTAGVAATSNPKTLNVVR